METILGLLGVLAFIPSVIAIAATVTWAVVKLSPGTREAKTREAKEQAS